MDINIPKGYSTIGDIMLCINGYYHAKMTDYVWIKDGWPLYYVKNGNCMEYWLSDTTTVRFSVYEGGGECTYQRLEGGVTDYADATSSNFGVRPTINYNFIVNNGSLVSENNKYSSTYGGGGTFSIYNYGEYPQTLVDELEAKYLEKLFQDDKLDTTGYTYAYLVDRKHKPEEYDYDMEFYYNGNKYVRAKVTSSSSYINDHYQDIIFDGYIWVKVEPIRWVVDVDDKYAISEKVIAGPMQYNNVPKNGIDGTYIGNYINNHLIKEINREFTYECTNNSTKTNKRCITVNKVDEWLEWSNNNLIHPVIHMYIVNTNGKYLYEDINWEEISNTLYNSNDLTSLKDILIDEVYFDLINIYQSLNITIDDVLNNNVDNNVLDNLSSSKKYLFVVLLTLIDEKDYDCIFKFIKNNLGKRYTKLYENLYGQCLNKRNSKSINKKRKFFSK